MYTVYMPTCSHCNISLRPQSLCLGTTNWKTKRLTMPSMLLCLTRI